METVSKKKFDRAKALSKKENVGIDLTVLSEEEINNLLVEMENPVKAQQRLAVQIKHFLDHRIKAEMKDKGFLSDHTRRWVESYNNTLEKIQKALYGDKHANLNLNFNANKISHADIAQKIRGIEAHADNRKRGKRRDEDKD